MKNPNNKNKTAKFGKNLKGKKKFTHFFFIQFCFSQESPRLQGKLIISLTNMIKYSRIFSETLLFFLEFLLNIVNKFKKIELFIFISYDRENGTSAMSVTVLKIEIKEFQIYVL